jgi:hypothetical protein
MEAENAQLQANSSPIFRWDKSDFSAKYNPECEVLTFRPALTDEGRTGKD